VKATIPRLRPVRARRMAVMLGIGLGAYLLVAYGILPLVWTEVERGHHPALEGLPKVTYNSDGIPADPLNVALVGMRPSWCQRCSPPTGTRPTQSRCAAV
jgi:hypothetical protein